MSRTERTLHHNSLLVPGLVLVLALAAACDPTKQSGTEGGPCYPNSTCNSALICASQICVRLPDGFTRIPDVGQQDAAPRDAARPDGPAADAAPPDAPAADLPPVKPNTFTTVKAGQFTMGSPKAEPCREPTGNGKETEHQVYLTHDLEVMVTEVTQGEFNKRLGYNPSFFSFCGLNCPAERTTWHDAAAFCNNLSTQKGLANCYSCSGSGQSLTCQTAASYSGTSFTTCKGYRLPTEAEWEYIYRAGTTSAFYAGSIISCTGSDPVADKIGWYNMNAQVRTHDVGQKQPNKWGLFDLGGNVYEWVHDWYEYDLGSATKKDPVGPSSGTLRVIRGGGLGSYARSMRAAYRWSQPAASRFPNLGFRCVRTK